MPNKLPEDMPDRMPDKVAECLPDRMPEDLPDRMPDRMSEDMPEDMPDRMPDRMPEDMPEHMPGRMPQDMPDRMPEDMSDRMPEDLPVTKRINVMVGITRSKVIVFFIPLPPSSTGQAETRNNDQAKSETNCSKHPPAAPAQRREQEEGKSTNQRYQRATKEGQGKGKGPGNVGLEKRDQKRDQNEMQTRSEPWQQQTPGK